MRRVRSSLRRDAIASRRTSAWLSSRSCCVPSAERCSCRRAASRALEALRFFSARLPRAVAVPTKLRVVNRLFGLDEGAQDRTLSSLLDAEPAARQPRLGLRAVIASLSRILRERTASVPEMFRILSGSNELASPMIEEVPLELDDRDWSSARMNFMLRTLLAIEHWTGHREVTLADIIERFVASRDRASDGHRR